MQQSCRDLVPYPHLSPTTRLRYSNSDSAPKQAIRFCEKLPAMGLRQATTTVWSGSGYTNTSPECQWMLSTSTSSPVALIPTCGEGGSGPQATARAFGSFTEEIQDI